jgi:NADPH:quinone reductase-like Zn-dependent oxidoreductase
VCAPEKALAPKPPSLTFEQAAAIPVAGAFTAVQGLRDKGRIQPGQTALINGAAGGVGTFAVQIAQAFGPTAPSRLAGARSAAGGCWSSSEDPTAATGSDR